MADSRSKRVRYFDYQVFPGEESPSPSPDADFWHQRYGIERRQSLPELGENGRCERPDCKGYRIPGYLKPVDSCLGSSGKSETRIRIAEAVTLYCPQCNGEAVYPLPGAVEKSSAQAAEKSPDVESRSVEVINLKSYSAAILSDPSVVYIGRQAEWRSHYLHASVLSNSFRMGLHGTRHEVCEMFLSQTLNPALEVRAGSVWDELVRLAERVIAGECLKLACWCIPQRCHGYDVAAAIMQIVRELKNYD